MHADDRAKWRTTVKEGVMREVVRSRRAREGDGNNGKHHPRRQRNKPSLLRLRERLPLQNWPYRSTPENVKRHNVLPIVSRDRRMSTSILKNLGCT